MNRMIELHRHIINPTPDEEDTRLSICPGEISQVHVGKGGYTIVTTSCGKLAVEESYEEVVAMMTGGDENAF